LFTGLIAATSGSPFTFRIGTGFSIAGYTAISSRTFSTISATTIYCT
jgi:hypothetical protein